MAMAKIEEGAPKNQCMAVKCDKCGKTTWKGCGAHVDAVMKNVAEQDKCTCPRD
ncbi:hypothetical protein FIBSPDRAFT_864688 [Athelia psychrophila]|uniref:Uncharacterized protein n=1 Tax=Athelia psychrophila TaxID=1759441 RepID=A0A166GCK0_9AGAM|nr:hypothetical protein FIBSPDRAFT_864688 [Fibularhizoctonia sp. CBS 109695]